MTSKPTRVSLSLIGCPIHSALCHIEAKSFVNYYFLLYGVSISASTGLKYFGSKNGGDIEEKVEKHGIKHDFNFFFPFSTFYNYFKLDSHFSLNNFRIFLIKILKFCQIIIWWHPWRTRHPNEYANISLNCFSYQTFSITSYIYIYIYIRRSLKKFPDFFLMGTFIDIKYMKL